MQTLRSISDLVEFLKFPSISADPARTLDVRRCADWLAEHLDRIGLQGIRVEPTAGHPIVYAEWRGAEDAPTVLIYGHYDVQPANPERAWASLPFVPVVRGEWLVARGASDDKGQLFTQLKAIEALLRESGGLPVNINLLVDGEEEIGSPNLAPFLRTNRDELEVDAVVISDTPMIGIDRPSLIYSMRGSLNAEITIKAHRGDLHSGIFGAAIRNPIEAMTALLASLYHEDGTIAIPHFYDRVRISSVAERQYMKASGPSNAKFAADAGTNHVWGEMGCNAYERSTVRPALVITGIHGGYQGPGAKAVLPAIAAAKLNIRLVPDQNPQEVEEMIRLHVADFAEAGLETTVHCTGHAWPVTLERNNWLVRAARQACIDGFGRAPSLLRNGGTLPVAGLVQRLLGAPPLALLGFGLPDDHKHAANERLHLPTYFRGIKTCSALLRRIAEQFRTNKAANLLTVKGRPNDH